MAAPATKLCVFCRCVEPISQPCAAIPTSRAIEFIAPLRAHEETLILGLQQHPSTLCPRCAAFDIVQVFKDSNPLDNTERANLSRSQRLEYSRSNAKYTMEFGELASLILSPNCPLCRLIFRIFPREGLGTTDVALKLMPFRSYVQQSGWDRYPTQSRSNPAIFLGVNQESHVIITERPRAGYVVSPDGYRTVLEDCINRHGPDCQATTSPELSLTRMIDVIDRKVVRCPEQCDYFALSYVWGGVVPAPNALETKTLPNTIEDAIVVTRKLGRRYLWVDALCIDQTPNPTPIQRAEKEKQLKMMDRIYSSATLTLVAVAGDSSNAGLPGVGRPRTHQVRETIAGHTFFTVPPTALAEMHASTWSTRAWTLQEELLSRRYLYFTSTHAEFACAEHRVPESLEVTEMVPGWPRPLPAWYKSIHSALGQCKDTPDDMLISMFWKVIGNYTSRRMSNDEDSINALAGVMAVIEKSVPAAACVWGLPLAAFPRFLGWIHDEEVETPKRRGAFPSWSWAGWEGGVKISNMLMLSKGWSDWKYRDMSRDMVIRYLGVNGAQIEVEGWRVSLEIRTEPFSEAVFPGTEEMIGYVEERDLVHHNTIPSGRYECLVVERFTYRKREGGPVYQMVFMLVLEPGGVGSGVAERKTLITLTTLPGVDLMCLGPVEKRVVLE
ncbi:heterokaryon incompatibility protein-domain-containing protein [Apiosordaria backusii]|uniref:Heterokaryon incompatibility protein-domain-containing protein n=1 Tax=Apiosordaria backusii TaxID=314023 RepID=A0AA40A795_9PEZI|nr:heterokaryon incompatibility protein-domain-containing protein [Apiosordaria backusii]